MNPFYEELCNATYMILLVIPFHYDNVRQSVSPIHARQRMLTFCNTSCAPVSTDPGQGLLLASDGKSSAVLARISPIYDLPYLLPCSSVHNTQPELLLVERYVPKEIADCQRTSRMEWRRVRNLMVGVGAEPPGILSFL